MGLKAQTLVDQHLDPFTAKEVGYKSGICPMVVIAETGESTEFRLQAAQNFRNRPDVFSLVRHVITRQCEKIRLQAIRELNGALDMIQAGEGAVMCVRKVDDAEPVELFWQPF